MWRERKNVKTSSGQRKQKLIIKKVHKKSSLKTVKPHHTAPAPLKNTSAHGFYITSIVENAKGALEHNKGTADRAKQRATTYYTRPRMDRFSGMWDYDPNPSSEKQRHKQIAYTCKMRRGQILKRFEDIMSY